MSFTEKPRILFYPVNYSWKVSEEATASETRLAEEKQKLAASTEELESSIPATSASLSVNLASRLGVSNFWVSWAKLSVLLGNL